MSRVSSNERVARDVRTFLVKTRQVSFSGSSVLAKLMESFLGGVGGIGGCRKMENEVEIEEARVNT